MFIDRLHNSQALLDESSITTTDLYRWLVETIRLCPSAAKLHPLLLPHGAQPTQSSSALVYAASIPQEPSYDNVCRLVGLPVRHLYIREVNRNKRPAALATDALCEVADVHFSYIHAGDRPLTMGQLTAFLEEFMLPVERYGHTIVRVASVGEQCSRRASRQQMNVREAELTEARLVAFGADLQAVPLIRFAAAA